MASETDLTDVSSKSAFCNEIPNIIEPSISPSSERLTELRFIIDRVKNLQSNPSIHLYSIMPEGKGMSAVDVSQNLCHLAYSFLHDHEIHLVARNSLSVDIARNDSRTTWLNFSSARNQLTELGESEQRKAEYLHPPQEIFIKHDDVSGLRFSSNDNLLLSCSLNGSVKVISTTTYRVLKDYDGLGSSTDIDVNTVTTQFVTANNLTSKFKFHAAYLYDFERKSAVKCFSGHENSLKCVRFHPNGLYIATASSDKSIKLWSIRESKQVRCFKDEGLQPEKITFSPDGKYIASTHSGCVKIWDISTGKKLKCLETFNPEPVILNVCYNIDGSMLAAGGSDKKIHIWNIKSGGSSEMIPDYDLLKSEYLDKSIFSVKSAANFFSCVTE